MKGQQLDRIVFGKFKDLIPTPNLLEYQLKSYEDFIQRNVEPKNRKNQGLERMFREFFPITSSYGSLRLEYSSYKIEENHPPHNSIDECRKRSKTYSAIVKAKLKITDSDGSKIQEGWVTVCELPLMTETGSFIINGTERVVVIQLHKSPGILFSRETNLQYGKDIYNARIAPYKGSWVELENTKDSIFQFKIERKKKVAFTTFVQALGFWKDNLDIIKEFFQKNVRKLTTADDYSNLVGSFLADELINEETGEIIYDAGSYIDGDVADYLSVQGIKKIEVHTPGEEQYFLVNSLLDNEARTSDEAAIDFFKKMRPHDIATLEGARNFVNKYFFEEIRYSLADVGRYKLNSKLGLKVDINNHFLTKEDIRATVNYIFKLQRNEGILDDINSLSNRRIRGVGELVEMQFRLGLSRIERHAKEKLSLNDPYTVNMQSILNTKFLYSVIMDFFASGQLSQFMDQTNPLSELTHKRRVSSLGKGGLSKERVTFDVRDVHSSHYGRLCTVETPEGASIGLTNSLASFAKINDFGFITTPYAKVEKGVANFDKVDYLTYDEEADKFIAPFGTSIDKSGKLKDSEVVCRYAAEDNVLSVAREEVDYIDVSSKQTVSVSTSLIPFLEHTDANRALTGSNMQRQAVPLVRTEAPLIATGVETQVAKDSFAVVTATEDGTVSYVDSAKIIVNSKKGLKEYDLMNFFRSNHGMSLTNVPLVNVGDKVKKGQIIADGPSTKNGELSIGKNILVAFMPWGGYNFEDAILISERLSKEDVFTSVHIESYDVEIRTTKLGNEELTRELPNVTENAVKDLDERGIIRVGAEVSSGDILVGKITPKSEIEPAAEEKLLRAVFGKKAREVKDTSLRLSHGAKGTVVGIIEQSKEAGDNLPVGISNIIKVFVAEKRKITVGDKMCGRHGNKGIVSRILPEADMPFLPDGRPVDIVLNPLGIPSRMNIGQLLETHLGLAAKELGLYMTTPVFDGAKESEIKDYLKKAGYSEDGKSVLFDGRTGEPFDNRVLVGYIYMLKLHHLVEDKMHARSIGPYSLVTQQPLGGKAQFGGQRLGEMEVWALEAYGASNILREMLTIKSDDIVGRTKAYEAIVRDGKMPVPGAPESFKVLLREFNSLGLNATIYDEDGQEVAVDEEARYILNKDRINRESLESNEEENS